MRPDYNSLLHGDATYVAQALHHGHPILHDDLIPALINAMRRIDLLESQVQDLNDTVDQQDRLLKVLFSERV